MDSLTLVTLLRDLALLPEDDAWERQILDLSRRFPDSRSLARELIQLSLLTPYQANQLLTGKGQTLVVGQYRILERLGEGGMGQVFKARHCLLHRLVALKIIRPEKVTSTTAVSRFLREIEAAGKIAHPNFVRAYDGGEIDDTYYFAMQYVPGTDLSRQVKQNGPLPIGRACDYVYQAAAGLQHIHESGLVHRDVKPSNLMITDAPEARPTTEDGPDSGIGVPNQVKILDLGVARLCEDATMGGGGRSALTQLGVIMGTADYMAPEQARDSREADACSDIYALGCTLYFVLTGQPPFPGGNAIENMLRHQLDEPTPLESLRPEVPAELAVVVRRMMAKHVAERYQTATAVMEALEPFVGVAPSGPTLAPVSVVPAALVPARNGPVLTPVVLLPPEAVPGSGAGAVSGWVWVGAASAITCAVVILIVLLRLVSG